MNAAVDIAAEQDARRSGNLDPKQIRQRGFSQGLSFSPVQAGLSTSKPPSARTPKPVATPLCDNGSEELDIVGHEDSGTGVTGSVKIPLPRNPASTFGEIPLCRHDGLARCSLQAT